MATRQRTLVCHGEKRRHHLDDRRRNRLVTVSSHSVAALVYWLYCGGGGQWPVATVLKPTDVRNFLPTILREVLKISSCFLVTLSKIPCSTSLKYLSRVMIS